MKDRSAAYIQLMEAIQAGQMNRIEDILSQEGRTELLNHRPQSQDTNYIPPIVQAIKSDQIAVVRYLVESGADVNYRLVGGDTPLHRAYKGKKPDIAELLIELGADTRARSDLGTRVFDTCLLLGDMELVNFFIQQGESLQYANERGLTTLHLACMSPNPELVQLILEKTSFRLSDKNHKNERPIDRVEDWSVFQYCLSVEPGIELNTKNTAGDYSIHRFAQKGCVEILAYLLEQGVDIDLRGKEKNSLLHYAVNAQSIELVTLLIQRGADVNAKNSYHYRPIHWVAYSNHTAIAKLLIENGADLNKAIRSFDIFDEPTGRETALYLAIDQGNIEMAQFLIEQGADVHANNSLHHNDTALYLACLRDQHSVVQSLLAQGGDPNEEKAAFSIQSERVLELMLSAGLDAQKMNKYNESLLDYLKKKGLDKSASLSGVLKRSVDKKEEGKYKTEWEDIVKIRRGWLQSIIKRKEKWQKMGLEPLSNAAFDSEEILHKEIYRFHPRKIVDLSFKIEKSYTKAAKKKSNEALMDELKNADFFIKNAAIQKLAKKQLNREQQDSFESTLIFLTRKAQEDFAIKMQASEALVGIASESSIAAVLENARHVLKENRQVALTSLAFGSYQSEAVVDLLIECLEQANHSNIKIAAMMGLKTQQASRAADVLMMQLKDGDQHVRSHAIGLLVTLEIQQSIDPILQVIRDGDYENVVTAALDALSNLGGKALRQQLDAILDEQDGAGSCYQKINSLMTEEKSIVEFESADSPQNYWPRIRSIQTFENTRDSQNQQRLINQLSSQYAGIREAASYALGNTESSLAISALMDSLQDDNELVRRTTATALGKIKAVQAKEALAACLEDSSSLVRASATAALACLAQTGQTDPEDLLALALRGDEESTRLDAIKALAERQPDQLESQLMPIIQNEAQPLRQRDRAIAILAHIDPLRALPVLMMLLGSSQLRTGIVKALSASSHAPSVDLLLNYLEDENARVRSVAAEVLGNLQAQEALDALQEILMEDDDGYVQYCAMIALEKIDLDASIPVLLECLESKFSDDELRLALASILQEYRESDSRIDKALIKWDKA